MTDDERKTRIEQLLAHVWMVRTFLKHSEEGEEDDDLREIFRGLYDYMMALAGPVASEGAASYVKMARKKLRKLREATARFAELQPEISTHTNFQMAVLSLNVATAEIATLLEITPEEKPGGDSVG